MADTNKMTIPLIGIIVVLALILVYVLFISNKKEEVKTDQTADTTLVVDSTKSLTEEPEVKVKKSSNTHKGKEEPKVEEDTQKGGKQFGNETKGKQESGTLVDKRTNLKNAQDKSGNQIPTTYSDDTKNDKRKILQQQQEKQDKK